MQYLKESKIFFKWWIKMMIIVVFSNFQKDIPFVMIMADIFLREDIIKLLNNKFVIIIGDSSKRLMIIYIWWYIIDKLTTISSSSAIFFLFNLVQRAIYKDMVMLLQRNLYLKDRHLRNKASEQLKTTKYY